MNGDIKITSVPVGPLRTNVWVLTPPGEGPAVVIDPGDELDRIEAILAGREVGLAVLTHTHWDHVGAVQKLRQRHDTPVVAHADDGPVWPSELDHLRRYHHWDAGTATRSLLEAGCPLHSGAPSELWDGEVTGHLRHGDRLHVGKIRLEVIHTPGHTPGGICLRLGTHVFSGDTLFPGGPGLTGPPHSSFPDIIDSIAGRLFATLADDVTVHPGHGPDTTIGKERAQLDDWRARGW